MKRRLYRRCRGHVWLITATILLMIGAPAFAQGTIEVNVAQWPDALDLCQSPWMGDICESDRELRQNLGVAGVPHQEEIPLHEKITSRMDASGQVTWTWQGPAPNGPVSFTLLDGTRIQLRLPTTNPPEPETSPNGTVTPVTTLELRSNPEKSWRHSAGAGLFLLAFVFFLSVLRRRKVELDFDTPPIEIPVDVPLQANTEVSLATVTTTDDEIIDLEIIDPSPKEATSPPQRLLKAPSQIRAKQPMMMYTAPSVAQALLNDIAAMHRSERDGIEQALAATQRLAEWCQCLLSVLRRNALPSEQLPPPAQREWRLAVTVVEGFQKQEVITLADLSRSSSCDEGLRRAGLLDPSKPLNLRLRQLLMPASRLAEATVAIQYLVEAFPIEHLEASERRRLHETLRNELNASSLPLCFHELVSEVAAGLDLVYQEVRYYRSRVGDPSMEKVGDAWRRLPLVERLGFEATTDEGVIVRLEEPFFFGTNGSRVSGLAWIAH